MGSVTLRLSLILLLAMGSPAAAQTVTATPGRESKAILVLHSYGYDTPARVVFDASLTRAIREDGELVGRLLAAVQAVERLVVLAQDGAQLSDLVPELSLALLRGVHVPGQDRLGGQTLDEDGRIIETGCPVTILQGARDKDVPKEHALKLVQHIVNDPVTFTLVPDGDHRLSRDQDLALLERAIEGLMGD